MANKDVSEDLQGFPTKTCTNPHSDWHAGGGARSIYIYIIYKMLLFTRDTYCKPILMSRIHWIVLDFILLKL